MGIRTGFFALVVLAAAAPAASAGEGFGGLYGGFTLGAHSRTADWYTTEVRYRNGTRVEPGNPANTTTIPNGTALPGFLSDPTDSFKDGAYGVGLLLGYNFELATNFIVGVELAAGSAPTYEKHDVVIPGLGTSADDPVTTVAVKTSKPLVAGLTFGYVVAENTLAYVRGNYERIVVTPETTSTSCPASNLNHRDAAHTTGTQVTTAPIPCNPAAAVTSFNSHNKLYGWGVGLGVERKFGDTFALRLEYRRSEFGKTKEFTAITEGADVFGADARIDMKRTNTVELGVLFHF